MADTLYPWDRAPKWAICAAAEHAGVFWSSVRMIWAGDCWVEDGEWYEIVQTKFIKNWWVDVEHEDSLEFRPGWIEQHRLAQELKEFERELAPTQHGSW